MSFWRSGSFSCFTCVFALGGVCVWEQKVASLDVTHENMQHVEEEQSDPKTSFTLPMCRFSDATHPCPQRETTQLQFPLLLWHGLNVVNVQLSFVLWLPEAFWAGEKPAGGHRGHRVGGEKTLPLLQSWRTDCLTDYEVSHSSRNILPPSSGGVCCVAGGCWVVSH